MLAAQVSPKAAKMKFVGYDVNLLGGHPAVQADHPALLLSPGTQRDKKPKEFRGDFTLEELASFLKKHADNKFKINARNLD